MIPTLAQTPPPAGLSSFIEIVAYLAVTISAIIIAWKQVTGRSDERRITPQPLEVKAHTSAASREDLEAVRTEAHGRIKRERGEINASITELQEEDRRLRDRLDSEIKALNQTIDEIPERVIRLLRATKDLI